ncbi:hypothetical protein MKZ38_005131 [Zalerion maritima]|uniref:Uncharacterized protein n=1 Tax=Zalerion maritima TaxID=339359 RepID=A0AAD5WR57_9PEZI|nr:hypothetical protein MKZ38_005131 [Zalerion maritima]
MAKPTSEATRILLATISKLPADPLRPNAQLGPALAARLKQQQASSSPPKEAELRKEAQAINLLVGDRFMRKYPVSDRIWHPPFQPEYFDNIIKDLDEAKSRSWFKHQWIKFRGMIRLQD